MKHVKKSTTTVGGAILCGKIRLGIAAIIVILSVPVLVYPNDEVPIKVKDVKGKLEFYKTITVEVENLTGYLKLPGKDASQFILYLDGRPLYGIKSRLIPGTERLQFDIRRTAESREEWNALLANPKRFSKPVQVSIGYENQNAFSGGVTYSLTVIKEGWFFALVVFGVLFLLGFRSLASSTDMLRRPLPKQKPELGGGRLYSLGRSQMAFWFILVIFSYIGIWMITSDVETITGSAVTLMGISGATALGATVVDSDKQKTAQKELIKRQIEKSKVEAASEEPEGKIRLQHVEKEIKALEKRKEQGEKPKGFIKDLLDDGNGISLHRFQIVVWTLVLGVIFVASVFNNLAIPEFNGTLLALMGISSGTYIGFKFPNE